MPGCCGSDSQKKACCPGDDKVSKDDVREYYGKRLKTSADLQTSACTVAKSSRIPKHVRDALSLVHDDVASKFYGCGLIAPECLEGCRILDLGSGSGMDCYALAKLVGPEGHVTGIDMTDEQLEVANKYIDYHREEFGYEKANTDFVKGYIEDLKSPGLQDNSFDIIVSNCVINLSTDKSSVLREAYRVLKNGGELYFSDIYADRQLSDDIMKHKVLWGECIAGALYWKELYTFAAELGFTIPRLVSAAEMAVERPELRAVLGDARFVSATYRLFKIDSSSQSKLATYKGKLIGKNDKCDFDHFTSFKTNEGMLVNGEMGGILSASRFSTHFDLEDTTEVPPAQDLHVDPFSVMVKGATSCCS